MGRKGAVDGRRQGALKVIMLSVPKLISQLNTTVQIKMTNGFIGSQLHRIFTKHSKKIQSYLLE